MRVGKDSQLQGEPTVFDGDGAGGHADDAVDLGAGSAPSKITFLTDDGAEDKSAGEM